MLKLIPVSDDLKSLEDTLNKLFEQNWHIQAIGEKIIILFLAPPMPDFSQLPKYEPLPTPSFKDTMNEVTTNMIEKINEGRNTRLEEIEDKLEKLEGLTFQILRGDMETK